MQLEAIYDQGKLEFIPPITLRNGRIRVRVEIPESENLPQPHGQHGEIQNTEYALPEAVKEKSLKMKARLDLIRNAPLAEEDELSELTEKQLGRIQAFALREEIKGNR